MSKKYLSTKNKNLYNKIVNFFTKKGNKVKATNLVNSAFDKISKSTGLSFNEILIKEGYAYKYEGGTKKKFDYSKYLNDSIDTNIENDKNKKD